MVEHCFLKAVYICICNGFSMKPKANIHKTGNHKIQMNGNKSNVKVTQNNIQTHRG